MCSACARARTHTHTHTHENTHTRKNTHTQTRTRARTHARTHKHTLPIFYGKWEETRGCRNALCNSALDPYELSLMQTDIMRTEAHRYIYSNCLQLLLYWLVKRQVATSDLAAHLTAASVQWRQRSVRTLSSQQAGHSSCKYLFGDNSLCARLYLCVWGGGG